jgi:hypothetical protein
MHMFWVLHSQPEYELFGYNCAAVPRLFHIVLARVGSFVLPWTRFFIPVFFVISHLVTTVPTSRSPVNLRRQDFVSAPKTQVDLSGPDQGCARNIQGFVN